MVNIQFKVFYKSKPDWKMGHFCGRGLMIPDGTILSIGHFPHKWVFHVLSVVMIRE